MPVDSAGNLDWNDLRYFLAAARDGSTLSAARSLRVSQTTVARRIAALEQALQLTLFDRRQAGYALTPAGEDLLRHAESVEAAAGAFAEAAAARSRDLRGTVRITTDEIFAISLLPPILRDLYELHPEIHIELDTSSQVRDLGAGEADIALRGTSVEQPAGVVGRRLCVDDWTLYCSRDYAERKGVPRSREDLKHHAIIGGGGGNLWRHYKAWIEKLGLEEQVAMHQGSSTGLLAGVRSGFGIGVLPCIIGDADPELVRCLPPRDDHGRTFWLLTHERVRQTPGVRAVIDFLYGRLSRHVRELEEKQAAA